MSASDAAPTVNEADEFPLEAPTDENRFVDMVELSCLPDMASL